MSYRRYIIHNQPFSEFAYRILTNLSEHQKNQLSDSELKMVRDDRSVSKLCIEGPHEKIDLLLSKVGVQWVKLYGPDEATIAEGIFSCYNQWEFPQKRLDTTAAISREGLFATSSRETMVMAMMMAQNCNTSVYHLSQYAIDIGKRGRTFNKMETYNDMVKRSAEGYATFNKLLLEQLNSMDWALETLLLTQNEVRILSALFDKRNAAIELAELAEMTKLAGSKAYLKKVVEKLEDQKLIVSDSGKAKPYSRKVYYIISPEGIKKIMSYINRIYKNTFDK